MELQIISHFSKGRICIYKIHLFTWNDSREGQLVSYRTWMYHNAHDALYYLL